MNDDRTRQAIDRAKELQQRLKQAAPKTQEQMKPLLEEAGERLRESAGMTSHQTDRVLDDVQGAVRSTVESAKKTAQTSRPMIESFLESARKTAQDLLEKKT